jgi:hypothetical protein
MISITNKEVLDRFFANLAVLDLENINCSENVQFTNKLKEILRDEEYSKLPGYLFLKKCIIDYFSKTNDQFDKSVETNTDISIKALFWGKSKQYVDPYLFIRVFDFTGMSIPENPTSYEDYAANFYSKNERVFINTELLISQSFKQEFINFGDLMTKNYKSPVALNSINSFTRREDTFNKIHQGIVKINSIKKDFLFLQHNKLLF